MNIIPGLTTTVADMIAPFIADLRGSSVRTIALFPTAIGPNERRDLYDLLESVPGLHVPHVHLRADMTHAETRYLMNRFGTEVFNIHPRASTFPFGDIPEDIVDRVYVENVEVEVSQSDLDRVAGLCPDYAHLENAILNHKSQYALATLSQLENASLGCCHVSAIRVGDPNRWSGGWDHHRMKSLADLDYMRRYAGYLPDSWVSLELENTLAEQLDAVERLTGILGTARSIA